MREKILTFIEKNSRINLKELAIMLGVDEASVANEIAAMEQENVICGYHTLIDWDKAGLEKVTAMIEVRVTPQRGMGFVFCGRYKQCQLYPNRTYPHGINIVQCIINCAVSTHMLIRYIKCERLGSSN